MQTSIISVIGNRCPCMRSPREKKTYFFFYHQENYLHGEANVDMTVKEKKRKREKKKKELDPVSSFRKCHHNYHSISFDILWI